MSHSRGRGAGRRWLRPSAAVFALLAAPAALAVDREARGEGASFTGLGDLPGGTFYSVANALSGDGSTVVGYSRSRSNASSFEAFVWTESSGMVGIGDLLSGDPKSQAKGVSFDGSVVVGYARRAGSGSTCFRWDANSGMVGLLDAQGGPQQGQANSISADGETIVGVRVVATGNESFRWTASEGVVGLGWLPAPNNIRDSFAFDVSSDGSAIAGSSYSFVGSSEPYRWTAETGLVGLGDVPGGFPYAIAYGISGDGETLVGPARLANLSDDEAYVWNTTTGFNFPDPQRGAEFGSHAQAVSADGSVVVGFADAGAMIWDAEHGLRQVQQVLEDEFHLDLAGWTLWFTSDVSEDGQTIAGFGMNPSGQTEAWIARLPRVATGVSALEVDSAPTLSLLSANPFTESIRMAVHAELEANDRPEVRVFDLSGRLRRRLLADGRGVVEWDSRDQDARVLESGIYFARSGDGPALKLIRRR